MQATSPPKRMSKSDVVAFEFIVCLTGTKFLHFVLNSHASDGKYSMYSLSFEFISIRMTFGSTQTRLGYNMLFLETYLKKKSY